MLEEEMQALRKLISRKKDILETLKKELFDLRVKKRKNPLRPIEGIEEVQGEIKEFEEEIENLEGKLQQEVERKAKNPLIP